MMQFILAAIVLLFLTQPAVWAAPSFAGAVTNGTVPAVGLVEVSGVVASRDNPAVLWAENDSGNPAVVYALDTQGHLLGTYVLPGNTDNEDIGIGPGPVTNVSYLYVADIGDNSSSRSSIILYQVPEPVVNAAWQTAHSMTNATLRGLRTITLNYPDGAHNAESEFTDPVTGDWFIVTKESTTARIYTAPKALLDTTNRIVLSFVGALAFDVPSGADISPLGNEIVIRQENFARLWSRTNGQSIGNALAGPSVAIPVFGQPGEPNGEAIGFDDYGGGYFTLSDSAATQPLRYFARTSFDGPAPPLHILAPGAVWKYLDNGADVGTVWRQPGYNDFGWSVGSSQFGFGDGDERTAVSYGPDAGNKFITTYFRKNFTVTNANRVANLKLKLLLADGANVYLNGALVANIGLGSNGVTHTTLASPMPEALRGTWQSYAINPQLLVEGTNTVAAELHLASPSAANMSFDLQLTATEAPAITGLTWMTNQLRLYLAGPSNSPTTIQAASNFTSWITLGNLVLTNGSGIYPDSTVTNLNFRFYRAARTLP